MINPIFVSHGSPTLPFDNVTARDFLIALAQNLPRPRAILSISAHWETESPTVNAVERNTTIHDFSGFPDELFKLQYNAPGSPELAQHISGLLDVAGLQTAIDTHRGLDHGAWVPLLLAFPKAEIPVVQLSVQTHLGPQHHLTLGRAIAPLAAQDVLIMASGSFTHNLRSVAWHDQKGEPDWVREFAEWFHKKLENEDELSLLHYRNLAPFAARNHPTEEHLMPLYVALGAAGEKAKAIRMHSSVTFDVLRMDAYEFSGG
jgi:4,5-DOPA dioxygenase extradiol